MLTLQNESFGYLVASADGTVRLAVLLNVSDGTSTFSLGEGAGDGTARQLLGSAGAEGGCVEPHGGPSWNSSRDRAPGRSAVTVFPGYRP